MIAKKPRRGDGCVFHEKGGKSWRGRYTLRTPSGAKKIRTVNLGLMENITEEEARKRLAEVMHRDGVQTDAISQIGHAGFVPLKEAKMEFHNRGAVSELIVSADLASKGFHVYRALSPGAPCDLIAMDVRGRAIRIEVKTGTRQEDGRVYIPRLRDQMGYFDILAVAFHDGTIEYRRHSDILNPAFPLDSPIASMETTSFPENNAN